MSHTEWCPECGDSFTATSRRKAEQQLSRHIDNCTPDTSQQPDLGDLLDQARKELGPW